MRERALNDGNIGAVPLVSADDRVGPPIGPVDVVLEEGDGKWVRQRLVTPQDLTRVRSVVSGRVDRIGAGVNPVDPPNQFNNILAKEIGGSMLLT